MFLISQGSVGQKQAGKGDSCALALSQTILTYLVHLFELMLIPYVDGQNVNPHRSQAASALRLGLKTHDRRRKPSAKVKENNNERFKHKKK